MGRIVGLTVLTLSLSVLAACTQGALNVEKVEPSSGIASGGDEVTIVGSGFEPGKTQAEVRFGLKKVESVMIASSRAIKVLTPPGEKGPVDISVMFDDGNSFKIPAGFRYVEAAESGNSRKAFFTGSREGTAKKPGAVEIEKK